MSKVAILGCGPAGLLAALAVDEAGHEPVIYSRKIKSEIFGAQYLHRAIPGLHAHNLAPDFSLNVIKIGSGEGYAYNVYGSRHEPVSWNKFQPGRHLAWDLRKAYSWLWGAFEDAIIETELTVSIVGSLCHNYPVVLSTVPAPVICDGYHKFAKRRIWVLHKYGDLLEGINDENLMYYNGCAHSSIVAAQLGTLVGPDWYRYSQIEGFRAWEYSAPPKHDDDRLTLSEGMKPRGTDCTCWTSWESFHRLGRYGRWEAGELTHHAYERTQKILTEVASVV